jgi:hypothetical protein
VLGCVYAEHFWFLIVKWAVRAALFLLPFYFLFTEMLNEEYKKIEKAVN